LAEEFVIESLNEIVRGRLNYFYYRHCSWSMSVLKYLLASLFCCSIFVKKEVGEREKQNITAR
jgi:hypothetical protein